MTPAPESIAALEDFRRARRQALIREVLARLTRQSNELLSYEEVRRALKLASQVERGLQEIPLDAIVGSVGRYQDFTRGFFPRADQMEHRWTRVRKAATDPKGWPPIEVYKIGDAYFVLDGNHRVSVARQLGLKTIQAYVTEIRTRVPFTPDTRPDELIIKAQYADFLEDTRLDELRPGADLTVTAAGAYRELRQHIEVHRYYMGLEQEREIPYSEAVASWYDNVYLPVVEVIRRQGLLQDFPGRTETDLYIWLSRHQAELQEALGWDIKPDTAATDLAAQHSRRPGRVLARVGERIRDALLPDELESGPAGARVSIQERGERAVLDILAPVSGEEVGWFGLEQALVLARREQSRLRGLHVVPRPADISRPEVQAVRERFDRRCQEVGVNGRLLVEAGPVAQVICERARWNDVVVLNMEYPPGETMRSRLSSGFRQILHRCPRPVLAVPRRVSPLNKPLLAYDGSPKADEALYISAYLCARWNQELVVVVVDENGRSAREAVRRAENYLRERGVAAEVLHLAGKAVPLILDTAAQRGCDVLAMGGYDSRPAVFEVVLGSTADAILRQTTIPVLICQ